MIIRNFLDKTMFILTYIGLYKNSSRLHGTFLSSYKNVEADTSPKFTTVPTIIFINCYGQVFNYITI